MESMNILYLILLILLHALIILNHGDDDGINLFNLKLMLFNIKNILQIMTMTQHILLFQGINNWRKTSKLLILI